MAILISFNLDWSSSFIKEKCVVKARLLKRLILIAILILLTGFITLWSFSFRYIKHLDAIASEGINSQNFNEIAEIIKNLPGTKKVFSIKNHYSLYGNGKVKKIDHFENKVSAEVDFEDPKKLENRIARISYNFPGPTNLSGTFLFATLSIDKELIGVGYQRSKTSIELTDWNDKKIRGPRLPVPENGKAFAILRPTATEPIPLGSSQADFDTTRIKTISILFVIGKYPDAIKKFPVHGKIHFDDIYAFSNIEILTKHFKKVDSRRITSDIFNVAYSIRKHFWKKNENDDLFWVGINYPWQNYGWDFGKNPYGNPENSGFSSRQQKLEKDFIGFKERGIKVVRIFIFCDFRTGLVYENGEIKKLDDYVWKDLETLFFTAGKVGIKIWPVLFDFSIADGLGWKQLHGERPEVIFYEQRSVFLVEILKPLLKAMDEWNKKYGEPVYALELMNEPENMVMLVFPGYFESLKNLFIDLTNIIHQETSFKVTLGSNSIVDMQRWWKGLDIDVWQFHFYPYMKLEHEQIPLNLKRVDIKISGPIICGEIDPVNLEENFKQIKENGYNGLLVWSWQSGEGLGISRSKELSDEFDLFVESLNNEKNNKKEAQ